MLQKPILVLRGDDIFIRYLSESFLLFNRREMSTIISAPMTLPSDQVPDIYNADSLPGLSAEYSDGEYTVTTVAGHRAACWKLGRLRFRWRCEGFW